VINILKKLLTFFTQIAASELKEKKEKKQRLDETKCNTINILKKLLTFFIQIVAFELKEKKRKKKIEHLKKITNLFYPNCSFRI
jgi:hypothetical protein